MGGKDNLRPPRTSEEARERGRNGGIKSGEARRRKRDAKNAARLILNLAASPSIEKNLKELGVEENDCTNLVAIMGRAFLKAMTGDVGAMSFLVETAVITPRAKMAEERHKRDMQEGTATSNIIDDWVASIPDVGSDGGENGE